MSARRRSGDGRAGRKSLAARAATAPVRGGAPALVAAAALILAACGAETESEGAGAAMTSRAGELPAAVTISDPGLHPEGVEYDAGGERFLVSSVTRGTVTAVSDDGTHTVVVDDTALVNTIGIHIDRANDRLLVADADLGVFSGTDGRAALGSYDLETGERIFHVDLAALGGPGRHFANDVTTDEDGNAYVTDSFAPVIYRVSSAGEASVFVRDSALAPTDFGLNGIDLHPDGYLLVAQAGRRQLLRITLADPTAIHVVELGEAFGADGLTLTAARDLIAVATTGEGEATRTEVLRIRSTDSWRTAEIVTRAPAAENATTAAVRGDVVYVVDARFADMGAEPPAPTFDITRVEFP